MIGFLRSLVFLLVLGALSCVRPAPVGLARVQLCVSYEKGGRYEGPPRATKGASACADFEPAPAETE